MIFSLFKKGKDEEKKPDMVDQDDSADIQENEDAVLGTGQAENVVLADQEKKKSKITKENYALSKSSKKTRSNRVVHTKRSWNKKSVDAKELVHVYDYLKKPIITEKTAAATEKGIYTFRVDHRATKHDIMNAIEARYNIVPEKVRIAKVASKPKRVRIPGQERSIGYTTGGKKAYVYLKKGDTIQLT